MVSTRKSPVLVVVQLTGGNDYLNTIVPYTDPNYYDSRTILSIPEAEVLKIDETLGMHPAMGPVKAIYDSGDMAIIHGIGYENSVRSHFRSMDIWHTCEPDRVGTEGWLGRAVRDIDPSGENPVTGVNIGEALPRALAAPGVSIAAVGDVSDYGLLTSVKEQEQRSEMLERFTNMYSPAIGTGPVMDYMGRTGLDALKGADILKAAPAQYSSTVEYGATPIAKSLRDVAMIHQADLGTRIFYTQHGIFDTHANQAPTHTRLWEELSAAVTDFWADLQEHQVDDNVTMFLFSEFGRRTRDNGSGTDHGSAGVAFLIGPSVNGGMYSEYPVTKASALQQGDLVPNLDFRGVYSGILEDWMGLDAVPIVNGQFEQPSFFKGNGGSA